MEMNKREVFNTVKAHLLSQDAKALSDVGCAYRGEGNKKCAIGCLIKDEYYDARIERKTVESADVKAAVQNSLGCTLDRQEIDFLTDLQVIHDEALVENWPAALNTFEERNFND